MSSDLGGLSTALADRYRIERELGAGGMATVYLAHDVRHDRKVALKVLRPELSAILGAARFLTEIKTTANLQHPHILSLFDSGEADGTVFYVMPYVEGESLRDRIKRDHQLPVEEAVRIAREVLDALEYAHQHGIVHRDIKPENILLHGGHAMVADFGIALAASKVEGGSRMTETGMSLGTPHYMSPEQAMGEREITPKADIYALGCVLYEMLTAEPPFVGATAQAIFARVLTDEPRSLTLQRKTIPPHIEAAVKTALQKLPADRFGSARAFADAIADPRYSGGRSAMAPAAPAATASSRASYRRAAWVGAAAAVGTLVGGFVLGRGTAPKPREIPVHFTITVPESTTSVFRCCGRAIAVSPDGSTIVFVGIRGAHGALYRRAIGQLESVEIPGTVEASIPFFSPDGIWLAFESEGKLRKVAMSGGPATPIAATSNVNGASWTDENVIVFSQGNRIWTVPAAGGTPRVVPTTDSVTRYWHPFALPGGRSVLVLASDGNGGGGGADQARVAVMDLATGSLDTLGYGMRAEYADGYLMFGAPDATLLAQPFDAKRRKTTGQATVLLSGVRIPGGLNHEFAITKSGWLAYEPGAGGSVETLRAFASSGTTTIALPGRQGDNLEDPAVSPDSRFIALRLVPSNAGARPDLWILDRPQGTLTRFTVGGGLTPVWSRDGKRIAYAVPSGDSSIAPGIYVRSADQRGVAQLVLPGRYMFPASWLPGDRGLVFYSQFRTKNKGDVGVVTLGDTTPRWVLNSDFEEFNPQLSQDGTRLAFASNRTGKDELYVQPMATGSAPTQISTEGGHSPRWSDDGRTLYYAQGTAIVAAGLQAGEGIAVTSRKMVMEGKVVDFNSTNVNWDLFPGGKSILYVDQAGTGAPRIAMIQHWVELVRAMGAPR